MSTQRRRVALLLAVAALVPPCELSSAQTADGLTITQLVMNQVEVSARSLERRCLVVNAALKTTFDAAIENQLSRVPTIVQTLLATDRLKSLATVDVPRDILDETVQGVAATEATGKQPSRRVCRNALAQMQSEPKKQLSDEIFALMIYAKALIEKRNEARQ
jgi:hypothetical protein